MCIRRQVLMMLAVHAQSDGDHDEHGSAVLAHTIRCVLAVNHVCGTHVLVFSEKCS